VPEHALTVGQRVFMVAEGPEALPLAARLEDCGRLTLLITGGRDRFRKEPDHRVLWGRLIGMQGHLGSFALSVAEAGGNGTPESHLRTYGADQVVWATPLPLPVKSRTGIHRVQDFSAQGVDAAAQAVLALTGLRAVHPRLPL
jgi:hypothetical protein